jgi:prepilin-type N-terminal cleavage/methylation domain-containing protein
MQLRNQRLQTQSRPRSRQTRGFTLIELLIGIAISTILLIALYRVFESNSALARTQTDVANMQQSLRIGQTEMAKMVRMAGRGGLPDALVNGGIRLTPALVVRDNAGTAGDPLPAEIAPGLANSPQLVVGTDVLTVRGVFNTPVYQVNNANPASFTLRDAAGQPTTDPLQATSGEVVITDPSTSGIPQDLTALTDAIDSLVPEALILVSPVDQSIYAIVELTGGAVGPGQVTLQFAVQGGSHTAEYASLYASGTGAAPALPQALSATSLVGIVEEYRFYIRDGLPYPTLSMAWMLPGTEVPHDGIADTRLDVADNVIDLQIALGFDSNLGEPLADRNGDGRVDEDDIIITETDNGQNDDWLFNSDQDDPVASPWIPPWSDDPLSGFPPQPELYFVRINTLVRTLAFQRNYQAPSVAGIENNDPGQLDLNTFDERRFRRQLLQTVVDLRNI